MGRGTRDREGEDRGESELWNIWWLISCYPGVVAIVILSGHLYLGCHCSNLCAAAAAAVISPVLLPPPCKLLLLLLAL